MKTAPESGERLKALTPERTSRIVTYRFPFVGALLGCLMILGYHSGIVMIPPNEARIESAALKYFKVLSEHQLSPETPAQAMNDRTFLWTSKELRAVDQRIQRSWNVALLADVRTQYKQAYAELTTVLEDSLLRKVAYRAGQTPWYSLVTYSFIHQHLVPLVLGLVLLLFIATREEKNWNPLVILLLWVLGSVGAALGGSLNPVLQRTFTMGSISPIAALVGAFTFARWKSKFQLRTQTLSCRMVPFVWLLSLGGVYGLTSIPIENLGIMGGTGFLTGLVIAALFRLNRKRPPEVIVENYSETDSEVLIALDHFQVKDYGPAERHLKRGLFTDPEHADANRYLAYIYSAGVDPNKAIPHAKKALAGDIKSSNADMALETYRRITAAIPELDWGQDLLWQFANLLARRRRYNEAVEIYKLLWTSNPDSTIGRKALCHAGELCYEKLRDREQACEIFHLIKTNCLEEHWQNFADEWLSKFSCQQPPGPD